jgi:hypothetical protein
MPHYHCISIDAQIGELGIYEQASLDETRDNAISEQLGKESSLFRADSSIQLTIPSEKPAGIISK